MRITQRIKKAGVRRSRRAGMELAQAFSTASQMALFCPSGMDVWMQRELSGCSGWDRREPSRGH